jgi:hypothetical protein
MKNMIKLPVLLVGLMLLFAGTTQTAKAQQEDVSLQSFYDELSPYGQWIQDPQYGYVWRPDVDQEEFRPYYSNGRWAMTEYGNTWVSNYDWGWAPFHYGRWVYNRYNSWVWIPDTVWGPAWVSWRSGGGYYGWAPLGPSISIGINIGRGGYRVPDMCWNFIPYNSIYYNNYPRYNYGRNRVYIQNTVIINNTYVRNNRTYYTGPRADDIRSRTNQNVTVYNVNRSSRAGASRIDNNTVNIYNPRASRGNADNNNAAPRNAIQGNINRGPVAGRDNNNNNASNRSDRGNGNITQGDRNLGNDGRGTANGNMTRGSRGNSDGVNSIQRGRDMDNRSGNVNVQNGNSRSTDAYNRVGSDNNSTPTQRVDRNQPNSSQAQTQPQQRIERSIEMPQQQKVQQQQQVDRQQPVLQQQAPQQRVERQQPVQQQAQPQQRNVERSQAQPQRVERTQSAPEQRSSSSGSESRGERGGGGGRPGRG